ncbi:uncharacterized protein F5891DRAFT_1180865 [Suillus fuscotomentosus]|uniref:F-box domain-containing protein n=1 Tax=Suillus fuscotomentosus TaxID=1912939 RepID=A0AAD4HSX3_9AGAM|nr:uncharacterized protein F5891DRAFT_1180865 [Suillus fuscotomentosus]KAG1907843.1 hypothetical protein F5891DRAFT_1180865 [Suillus fuscotomentosus]
MRALWTRQNRFSPISSIPPEILGAIFVHHAQQMRSLYSPDTPAFLSWLIVGHICRHWREVALGTPELWATPFLNSSQATEEMLLRSKMAPLNLRTGLRYCVVSVQRLTVLGIKELSPECLPTLDELISVLRCMPALHTLELEDALPTLPPQTTSLPCTPRALNVQLPHLKRLLLAAKILEVANVLARVELPDSTMLEVQLRCSAFSSMNPNQEWNLSLPIISRALESCFKATPAKSRRVPRTLRLHTFTYNMLVQYSTVWNPSWVPDYFPDSQWTVVLYFDSEISTAILSDLWRLVPFNNLEALYIEGFFTCWDGFWTDFLGHGAARNLANIYLQGTRRLFEDLFTSLRSQRHSLARSAVGCSQQGQIFAPALSHLALDSVEFDTSFWSFRRVSDLFDVLVDRANEGRGLDHLTITRCTGITTHDVRLLREVVANLDWDEDDATG